MPIVMHHSEQACTALLVHISLPNSVLMSVVLNCILFLSMLILFSNTCVIVAVFLVLSSKCDQLFHLLYSYHRCISFAIIVRVT